MPNNRALMGLLLVATLAAGLATWWLRDPIAPPSPPANGGQTNPRGQVDPATAGGTTKPASGQTAEASNGTAEPAGPIRIEVGASTGTDRRPCQLEVTVLEEHLGRRTPIPFTEVAAVLTDLGLANAIARTNEQGIAEYSFVGGHGLAVSCLAGIGGQSEATLQAETTVRATILVQPKVFATGKVIDPSGVGVADADVMLLRWAKDKHSVGSMWRIGRSRRDGSIRIPVGLGGQICATHPSYISSDMAMLRPKRDASKPPTTQVFELTLRLDAATIVGLIHDDAGRPVRNAEIQVRAVRPGANGAKLVGPPARTQSDEQGRYRLTGLPAGDVHWSACAKHHGWRESRASLHQNGHNRIDIELPKPAAIEGVVVAKNTGRPVAGAIVGAGQPGTLCYRATKSKRDGTYVLDDLGNGPTPVRAELEQYVATTQLHLLADYVAPWRAELELDGSGQMLEGIVVDAKQRPLADWTVIVRQGDRDPAGVTSGVDGRFSIAVEQPTGLDVRCFAPGRLPTSFADARVRNATVGQDVVLRAGLRQCTTIVGRVLGSGASGVPATIGCWHQQTREYARHTADGDGHFTIANVPIGTVNLTIEHTGHVAHETGDLPLQPGVPIDLGTMQLTLGGGLYGTVLGPSGTAPDSCTLELLIANPRRRMPAEYVGGSYRFSEVPAGRHTLFVQGQGLGGASFPITIKPGVDLPRDVQLGTGLFLRFRIRVPAKGGNQVTLMMRTKGKDTSWIATSAVQRDGANSPGFALFDTWMAPGTYEAIAVTPQGYEARANVTYASDGVEPFVMQLLPR